MTAYYNEIDPFAAQWLRELIARDMIAPGEVDERSIEDVKPDEIRNFTQCHFFAGIGVWSYSARLAGWPDDRPLWTGSCPCQPFSAAGKGGGFADERHLWPHWHYLIGGCQPPSVLGEQVASKDGLTWLDLVQADLEGSGYACGAVDTCSAGVGAPHIRQRLRFAAVRLADSDSYGRGETRSDIPAQERNGSFGNSTACGLGHTYCARTEAWLPEQEEREEGHAKEHDDRSDRLFRSDAGRSELDRVADTEDHRHERRGELREPAGWYGPAHCGGTQRPGPVNGFWADADWLGCRDGKFRPVRPGSFPLVDGAPARVGRLRGYGNAVDAQATKVFVESFLETVTGYHT